MLFIILFLNPEYVFRFRHIQYTRTKLDCLSCTTKKYTSGGYGYFRYFLYLLYFYYFYYFLYFSTFSQKVQNPYSIWYLHSSFIIHN